MHKWKAKVPDCAYKEGTLPYLNFFVECYERIVRDLWGVDECAGGMQ